MLTPHDRPPWGRGRVVSVPKHDLSTDWRQSPLPNSIPKFPEFCNFQDSWQFLEISTRACNAPSPNLNLNLSLDSVLFLVLLLVPLLLFVVLTLVSVLTLVPNSFVVVLILG